MNCIFCGLEITTEREDNTTVFSCHCKNCGEYRTTHQDLKAFQNLTENGLTNKMHLLSGYLREMTELGLPTELVTTDNY